MARLRGLLRQLRTLFRKESVDAEQYEEMAFHVEMQTQQFVREGIDPEEARRRALLAFGGLERYREERRQVSWVRGIEDAVADFRYAFRSLRRRPGFAATVAVTLGLGVGGTAAIFSVVDGLFLRAPQGVRDAELLRRVYIERDEGGVRTGPGGAAGSFVDYRVLRENLRSVESIASFISPRLVDLGTGSEIEQIRLTAVSPAYFGTLGVRAASGRLFDGGEASEGRLEPVVVVSHGFAERRLGGVEAALGETLVLNRQLLTIIGVAEKGFVGLDPLPVDAWIVTELAPQLGLLSGQALDMAEVAGLVHLVARLRDDADPPILEAEATAILEHAAEEYPNIDPTPVALTSSLVPASGPNRNAAADLSLWLGAVALLVLVIACANVANLLLARGMTRRRELAVRLSLGASRGRVARQQLVESIFLAGLGALVGIFLTYWGLTLARQFPLPPAAGRLDGRIVLFAIGVALLTGLVFGVFPALRARGVDTVPALRETRLSLGAGPARARRGLVALQVALSVVLLVGAMLFVRSLRQVYAIDPGLDLERVLTVEVNLQRVGYDTDEREQFYREAQSRLEALPGVERTAMVHFAPFSGVAYSIGWELPGVESGGFDKGPYRNLAGPGFFSTVGTRVLSGREFIPADARGEPTAIVNERMARALAPGGDAVNLCVALGNQVRDGGCTRIIGVVENQRHQYLEEADIPMIFLPRERDPSAISWGGPALLVRTQGEADDVAATVQTALQSLRPDLPYVNVEPLEAAVESDVLPYRIGATLFSLFGALALILSAVGLYGVLSYFVTERTPEIGVRRSLGASAERVVRMVVGQGMVPVAVGVVIGVLAAWAATRFLASLLFGIGAQDPASFLFALLFLLGVAITAAAVPARRAARVDPMVALRED